MTDDDLKKNAGPDGFVRHNTLHFKCHKIHAVFNDEFLL